MHHRINQRLTARFLNVDELQQWSGGMLTSSGMQFDWQFSKSSPPLLTHVMEVCLATACRAPYSIDSPPFNHLAGRLLLSRRF